MRCDKPGERRRLRAQEVVVVREAVVRRRGGQDARAAERGEAPRADAHPVERELDDLLRHVPVAVLGGDLGGVERLRVRELLVRVADAVAPGERDQLREDAELGALHGRFRDGVAGAVAEALLPERDDGVARGVVRGGVRVHVARVGGRVQPLGVDRLPFAGRDAVANDAVDEVCARR